MDARALKRFRFSLAEQRQNLADWLSSAPPWKKQLHLGQADERAVEAHIDVLERAIEQADEQTLGQCKVCHEDVGHSQLEMDYTCCVCLDHLSDEERGELEFELELSTKVQQALMPQEAPDIPGLELAAFSRPAAIVGGDYFDFYRFQDGAHGLLVGDAAGHGMSASLLMASVQSSLRILVPDHESPRDVIRRLNRLFFHNIRMTSFFSVFLARYDSGSGELTYVNAGHNPPLLFRARSDGSEPFHWLSPTGAAIGLVEEVEYGVETVLLAPDDVLLLYTDGVTEAASPLGEEFGQERLARSVQQVARRSAQEVVTELRTQLREFTGGQPLVDDATIVAIKAGGRRAYRPTG